MSGPANDGEIRVGQRDPLDAIQRCFPVGISRDEGDSGFHLSS
jgi:hypothetical protein